ncbi:MAG: hypothetical protein R3F20_13770 [Planctomycetota bacterium]
MSCNRLLRVLTIGLFVLGGQGRQAFAQGEVQTLFADSGCQAQGWFGAATVDLGDLDGDGAPEFAVAAPNLDLAGSNEGAVWIYTHETGGPRFIHRFEGGVAEGRLGFAIAPAGDIDGDGVRDLWLARPGGGVSMTDPGSVLLISGAWISSHKAPPGTGNCTGTVANSWVTEVGSGAPAPGTAWLFTWTTNVANSQFGYSIAGDADLDSDGVKDLVVGAPDELSAGNADGAVWVLGGAHARSIIVAPGPSYVDVLDPVTLASNGIIERLVGPTAPSGSYSFGNTVALIGDVNVDGTREIAVGDWTRGQQGSLTVFEGDTRIALKSLRGHTTGMESTQFGFTVCDLGDLNGDGYDEFAVGAPGQAPSEGDVYVIDGQAFVATLDESNMPIGTGPFTLPDPESVVGMAPPPTATVPVLRYLWGGDGGSGFGNDVSNRFGHALVGLDFDGDGTRDLAVSSVGFPNVLLRGIVQVFSGIDFAEIARVASDTDGDSLGYSIGRQSDANGNGRDQLLVGLRDGDLGGIDFGSIRVVQLRVTELSDVGVIGAEQGDAAGDWFGHQVASVGDVNGDGTADYAVGSRFASFMSAPSSGRLTIFDGSDDSILHRIEGAGGGDEIGREIAGIGDVNGDGFDDFIVGSRSVDAVGFDSGAVYVISGAHIAGNPGGTSQLSNAGTSGAELHVFVGLSGDSIGLAIANLGDLDQDGLDDLGISSRHGAASFGEVFVVSGAYVVTAPVSSSTLNSGHAGLIHYLQGTEAHGIFGQSIANVGLIDGDPVPDFAVGELDASGGAGKLHIFSGSSAAPIQVFEAPYLAHMGRSIVGVGDLDGDGRDELAVSGSGDFLAEGSVWILHGLTVAQLQSFAGPIVLGDPRNGPCGAPSIATQQPVYRCFAGAEASENFGFDLSALDLDGDGSRDLAVGIPNTPNGTVEVYSVDGAIELLFRFNGAGFNDRFALALNTIPDRNADGRDDLIVGAYANDQVGMDAGSITLFGANVPYPGSGEDLVQGSGVNDEPDGISVKYAEVASPTPQLLTYCLETPEGSFGGMAPVIIAQLASTTSLPPPIPGFPEVRMNIFDPTFTVLLDGNPANCAFCPSLPIDGRLELAYAIPMITVPDVSILIQGLALSVNADNGIFAASNTHEVRFR